MKKRSFTLIEILTVVVIIGVLAALSFSYLEPIKEKVSVRLAEKKLAVLLAAEKAYYIDTHTFWGSFPPKSLGFGGAVFMFADAARDLRGSLLPVLAQSFKFGDSPLAAYLGGEDYDNDPDWVFSAQVVSRVVVLQAVRRSGRYAGENLLIICNSDEDNLYTHYCATHPFASSQYSQHCIEDTS